MQKRSPMNDAARILLREINDLRTGLRPRTLRLALAAPRDYPVLLSTHNHDAGRVHGHGACTLEQLVCTRYDIVERALGVDGETYSLASLRELLRRLVDVDFEVRVCEEGVGYGGARQTPPEIATRIFGGLGVDMALLRTGFRIDSIRCAVLV